METEWKYYDDNYIVSSEGDVWSKFTNRMLNPTLDGRGYLQLMLYGKSVKVHRMVALTFLGTPPFAQDTVNHINTDKQDNRVSNLEYLSLVDNVKQAHADGLMPYGEDHGAAKLTEADVLRIKQLFVEHRLGDTEIASMFVVGRTTITKIRKGFIWKEVGKELKFSSNKPSGLSAEDIPKIRQLHKDGHYIRAIAKLYGVNERTIHSVLKGRSWVNY